MPDESNVKIAGLPYFEDYLREVLRPRVERIIQRDQASWQDMVWQAVIQQVLAEQPTGSHLDGATIDRILREVLGLRIDASISATFEGPGAGGPAARAADVPDRSGLAPVASASPNGAPDDAVVIDRRGEGNPLLRAVVGPRRTGPNGR